MLKRNGEAKSPTIYFYLTGMVTIFQETRLMKKILQGSSDYIIEERIAPITSREISQKALSSNQSPQGFFS